MAFFDAIRASGIPTAVLATASAALMICAAFHMQPLAAQPVNRTLEQSCWASQEGCSAYWNVYGSISGGSVWYEDKMATDPHARAIDRSLNGIIAQLSRCGIRSASAPSRWFLNFTGNLAVVFSGPFQKKADAGRELVRSRRCGVTGYSKFSQFVHVGND